MLCFVCLPPGIRNGEIEALAKAGIHLFLEKPLALKRDILHSIDTAISDAGVISQVGLHYRFKDSTRRIVAESNNGTSGRPVLFWTHAIGAALSPQRGGKIQT